MAVNLKKTDIEETNSQGKNKMLRNFPSAFEIFKKINQTKTKRINQKPSLSFHFAYYSINSILSFKVEVISNSSIYIGPRIRGKSSVWSTICTLNTSTAVGVINKKKQNTHARKKKYKSKNKTNEIKTTPLPPPPPKKNPNKTA